MNLASFGVPYSINNIESSMGISPSNTPFINNSLQLLLLTMPFSTRLYSFWHFSNSSSQLLYPYLPKYALEMSNGYS